MTSPDRPAPAVIDPRGIEAISRGREYALPGGPDAALLLHGLTGATFEMHHLASRLHGAGIRSLAPVMAGHGGDPRALVGLPWQDWVAQAVCDLDRLGPARRTVLAGSSMGALVACAVARARPERVDGLVLLAPAMQLQPTGRLGALLGRIGLLRRWVVPKGSGSDVHDADMRRRNPCLTGVPLAAVAELQRLAAHVATIAPEVRVPALVVAGGQDHTVTLAGVRRLAGLLPGAGGEVLVLPESWHLVGVDVERERCGDAALRFIEALPLRAAGGAGQAVG